MSEFVEKLSGMRAFKSRKAASVKQVEDAESALDVTFAEEYREYLLTYGAASIFGHEFTGISSNSRISVVNVTLDEREFTNNCDTLYVVEQTNIDGIVIWQDSKGTIYKSNGGECEFLCNSLYDYIDLTL